jgi:hypothetical protein
LNRLASGLVAVAGLLLGSCNGSPREHVARPPFEELDALLRPGVQAEAVKRLPGAHYNVQSTFKVSPTQAPPPDPAVREARDGLTTHTDLWLDRRGQYRLNESNDQDGGRTIVRYGHDLAVALRYGKTIRRPALEPEPTRYLEEAVGAPWAAWETVRRFALVTRSDGPPVRFRISRASTPSEFVPSAADGTNLRRWRETVQVQDLEGTVQVEPRTGALAQFNLKARFTATREDRVPLTGEIVVASKLEAVGATPSIVPPTADELEPRARTIIEERALLGNLTPGGGKEGR